MAIANAKTVDALSHRLTTASVAFPCKPGATTTPSTEATTAHAAIDRTSQSMLPRRIDPDSDTAPPCDESGWPE